MTLTPEIAGSLGLPGNTRGAVITDVTDGSPAARAGLKAGEVIVEVVESYDRIATVVVRSDVYREYLHLARTRDGWKIVNALWAFTSEEGG